MVSKFLQSAKAAFRGLTLVLREEPNFRIEIFVGGAVVLLAFLLRVSRLEVALLILVSMIVLVLELSNTAAEHLVDLLRPRLHESVRRVKDITAATVLVASIGAAVIGVAIFLPRIIAFVTD
ncbi:MAG: diacylglycerol kinase family protein [Patescibacteria group bacterium]